MSIVSKPKAGLRRAGGLLTTAAVVGGSLLVLAPAAHAAPSPGPNFVVDSLVSESDANPGDGVCETASGDCTFLAALQETNAPGNTSPIAIAFADALGTADIVPVFADRMSSDALPVVEGAATLGASGANYVVDATVPVTIDFGGDISIFQNNDLDTAGILIRSNDVTVTNSPNIRAGSASYVIASENVTISNSTVSDPGSPILEIGIGLIDGANNVTITDFVANSVWHSAIAVARGQEVSNIAVNGLTVTSDGGDNTAGIYFAQQAGATDPTVTSNFSLNNASFEGISQRANIHLDGAGTVVDGLIVTDSVFNNTNIGGFGLLVDSNATLRNASVTNNSFNTSNQYNIWVRGYGVIEDSSFADNVADNTLYLFGAEHYWTSLKNVELVGNTVLGQTGGDSAVYLRSLMDNVLISGNTFEHITANVVIRVHGPNGVDEVKNVTIENNLFKDLEGTLIEAIYLQHNVTNGLISGNQFIQTEEWLAANPAYDHNWAIRTAAAAGWTISGNHIDGYGARGLSEAPIRVQTNGVTSVVGNTFGPRTNGTTDTREAETGARWFLWNVAPSNGQIQTLRPENVVLNGSQATFTAAQVTPEPGNTNVAGPFTLHVYWTASEHAEEYLGAITDVNPGQQVSIPTNRTGGFLRVQTVAQATGNVSQYSGLAATALQLEAPVIESATSEQVTGTGTPTATVVVRDSKGEPFGDATVDAEGRWIITGPVPCGETLTAVQTIGEVASSASEPYRTAECPIDPNAPRVTGVTGSAASGTGQPEATIEVRDEDGTVVGTATVAADGTWTVSGLACGVDYTAVQIVDGEEGEAVEFTTAACPAAPVVTDVTGPVVKGTGEPGAQVTVRDPKSQIVGSGVADQNGNWAIDASKLVCGTEHTVTQTVNGGESSPTKLTTVACATDGGDPLEKTGGELPVGGIVAGALSLLVLGAGALMLARRGRETTGQ